MASTTDPTGAVLIAAHAGHAVVETASPLTRLNYFDGKFLRGPDLQAEQAALLAQVRLANRAGGGGLVHGFDCTSGTGDTIRVSPGLGFDWAGRALLLTQEITLGVAALIAASAGTAAPEATGTVETGSGLFGPCPPGEEAGGPGTLAGEARFYLVSAHHIEAFCGEEDVYGKLCSEACVEGTQRSHIVEGVCFRATPVALALKQSPIPFTGCHLRSRAASALFERERREIAALVGAQGVISPLWCLGAAAMEGEGVPLALLGRAGGTTVFLDEWAARRERIEIPPAQYWAARLAMRSTRIFRAQIAQFQCQLECCLADAAGPGEPEGGPCAPERALLREAAERMRALLAHYAATAATLSTGTGAPAIDVGRVEAEIAAIEQAGAAGSSDRILLDCGIVETPSAGYLPVAPSSALTVNVQVRNLLGPGVDLRFCAVRPDFVPHALEEAQHMERICLLAGIEDPGAKPELDVLVPDGEIVERETGAAGTGHRAQAALSSALFEIGWPERPKATAEAVPATAGGSPATGRVTGLTVSNRVLTTRGTATPTLDLPLAGGAARLAAGPVGGRKACLAARADGKPAPAVAEGGAAGPSGIELDLWTELEIDGDPFAASPGDRVSLRLRFLGAGRDLRTARFERRSLSGAIRVENVAALAEGVEVSGRLSAEGLWRSELSAGGQTQTRSEVVPVAGEVVLRRRSQPGLPPNWSLTLLRSTLLAELPELRLVLEGIWTGPGTQEVRLFVRQATQGTLAAVSAGPAFRDHVLLQTRLKRDDAVLSPGNAWHESALAAISGIAEALASPAFEEEAVAALFPPPPPPESALDIRARLPWVLFHRRRSKLCAAEAPVAPPLPARSYRLHAIDAGDLTPADIAAAIAEGIDGVLARLPPSPDGTVRFAPGQPGLETPHADVRADWEAATGGPGRLVYSVVATQGAALDDGRALAEARLRALVDAIAPVTPRLEGFASEARETVPAALATALDGAILHFVRRVPAVCHTVYRLPTRQPEETRAALERYVKDPDGVRLADFVLRLGGTRLAAAPRFEAGSAEYLTGQDETQVAAAWGLAGGGTAMQGLALSAETGDAAQALVAEQAGRIAKTTGSALDLGAEEHRTVEPAILDTCPRATVLVVGLPGTECTTVALRVTSAPVQEDMRELVVRISESGLPEDGLAATGSGASFEILATLELEPGSGAPDPESRARLRAAWEDRAPDLDTGRAGVIAVAREASDEERAKEQAALVAETLGLAPETATTAVHAAGAPFPVDCRTVAILVANSRLI